MKIVIRRVRLRTRERKMAGWSSYHKVKGIAKVAKTPVPVIVSPAGIRVITV